MTKVVLQNWSGGVVNDPRSTLQGAARVVTNFDINTSPNRLIPYRSSEDGDSASSTSKKQNFCVALWLPGSTNVYKLFSLGVKSGAATAEILMKGLGTGGTSDLGDNGWDTPSNNQSSAGTTSFNLFVYYKKTGFIYGARAGTHIWYFDPTASTAWADSHQALTYTNIAQGLVHSKDDILYIPYDNKIAKNDNGTWTTAALTLPTQYYITSICEYKEFIAIACAPLDSTGSSRVYIWDRSTTLTTLSENIDWGSGQLKVLEELNGYLLGISLDSSNFNPRFIFRYYIGAGAVEFNQILGDTSAASLSIVKQKINNRLYFIMSTSLNGTVREGVWSFGKNPNGQGFNLVHERTPNNDTALSSGSMLGFFYVGGYLFQSFTINAGTYTLTKTDNTALYTATSIMESVVNPGMKLEDRPKLKQLQSISVGYKTQSAVSGQIVVKAKVDGGSNVTIVTATTTGVNVVEMPMAGIALNKGRELEFRLESTLGADIIYFDYDYDVIPTLA